MNGPRRAIYSQISGCARQYNFASMLLPRVLGQSSDSCDECASGLHIRSLVTGMVLLQAVAEYYVLTHGRGDQSVVESAA
ncbi:uncharacterized protein FMAN_14607 [Fusarium mangiferae]|uniref:Uncharacterized protein n=1 Tax=Fusarium mangiferae TaxID=192010 RepID=A0A1L7UAJ8_FUSMA|nr:uncharacterized protein FMAN_14607 [Fusarium mangiferae]CVL07740.1 uncharacterized protein FMAN_14607 [Fusarium mangiferae]